jgi:hypothetical protein
MVLYWYIKNKPSFLSNELSLFVVPEEDIVKFRAVGPVRTKASLAVTFNLFGTSFMIINSHFEGTFYSNESILS